MKALIISDNDFEDSELLYPYYRLKEEGIDVKIASPSYDTICGKHGYAVKVDLKTAGIDPDEFDILIIPGGKAPEKVRLDKHSLKIAKSFMEKNKTIGAICHGPQLLISTQLMKGRKVTCYKGIKDDIEAAGAEYSDKEVVVDKNLITSRQPSDLPAFCKEIIKRLN